MKRDVPLRWVPPEVVGMGVAEVETLLVDLSAV